MTDGRRTRTAYGRSLAYRIPPVGAGRRAAAADRTAVPAPPRPAGGTVGSPPRRWSPSPPCSPWRCCRTAARPTRATANVLRVMPLGDYDHLRPGQPHRVRYRKPLWNMVADDQSRYHRAVRRLAVQRRPAAAAQRGPLRLHHSTRSGPASTAGLAASRPDVILLHIGINDLNRDIAVATAPDRLAALIDQIYADRPGVLGGADGPDSHRGGHERGPAVEGGGVTTYGPPPSSAPSNSAAAPSGTLRARAHPRADGRHPAPGRRRVPADGGGVLPGADHRGGGRIPPAQPTDSPGLQTTQVMTIGVLNRRTG